MGKIRFA